jgi:hypothetical protein
LVVAMAMMHLQPNSRAAREAQQATVGLMLVQVVVMQGTAAGQQQLLGLLLGQRLGRCLLLWVFCCTSSTASAAAMVCHPTAARAAAAVQHQAA